MEQVWNTIKRYNMLQQGDTIVVGVSSGPDSVALLFLLKQCQEEYQLKLHVVHVNHMFRGKQAVEEAEFVQRLAEQWQIPCTIFHQDVPAYIVESGLSPQAAGHRIRYQCFDKVARSIGANKLALGHHSDDRAETVLLHLVQGCGIDGLASMPAKDGRVIRPLAEVSKEEIFAFCEEKQLFYYLDPSNQKEIYLRNKVRLKLIPFLQEHFNPKIKESLLKLEELAREDNLCLEEMAEHEYDRCVEVRNDEFMICLEVFNNIHLSLKRRLIRRIYQQILPDEQGLDFQGVDQVLRLAEMDNGYKKINLAKRVVAEKRYGQLILKKEVAIATVVEHTECYWHWNTEPKVSCMSYEFHGKIANQMPEKQNQWFTVVVDGEKVGNELIIRNRQPGDRIKPLGLKGTKKLKEFFIDRKVPIEQREQCPIVTNGREIVWIPGYTIGDQFKVTEDTKVYLVLHAQQN